MTPFTTIRHALTWLLLCSLLAGANCTMAQSEKKEGGAEIPGAVYYNLYPSFVVSFKGEKHLRFLKVDVTLRLQTSAAKEQVSNHLPRIRNDLIMLFSSQLESDLVAREGKERIRQEALKKIQEIVAEEEGSQGIIDLLFMNFVVQN